MSTEIRNIEVEFNFSTPQERKTQEERLNQAIIILSGGGEREVYSRNVHKDNGTLKVILRAQVPAQLADLHHGFESIFVGNSLGRLGAGYLGEFSGPIEIE